MARQTWDLSHNIQQTSQIGRIQYFLRIPTLPSDVFEIDSTLHYIMSPFRRRQPWDAMATMIFFFVPYRHTYPNIKQAIIDGHDMTVTNIFTKTVDNDNPRYPLTALLHPQRSQNPTLHDHLKGDYVSMWNRFFRDPELPEITASIFNGNKNNRLFGYPACHIPNMYNTMRGQGDHALTNADKVMSVSGGLDIEDLSQFIQEYKSERIREVYATEYYDEIMQRIYGVNVNIDADQRPLLLAVENQWLSGTTIRGTDAITLGAVRGVSEGVLRAKLRRTFIPEHGTLYGAIVLRYPQIFLDEEHYLEFFLNESAYNKWSGEDMTNDIAPTEINKRQMYFDAGDGTIMGEVPWNQWYRTHPNFIHPYFDKSLGYDRDDGYPLSMTPTSTNAAALKSELKVINPQQYDKLFHSRALEHAHFFGENRVKANRIIDTPDRSYNVGGIG